MQRTHGDIERVHKVEAERRRTAPQGAGCVGEGMRGQRKFARPPARSLAFRTGYTDKFFGLSVERLQLGIINRPVRSDTETGFHFHRVGMDAMRLTGKMQRRAANTAD